LLAIAAFSRSECFLFLVAADKSELVAARKTGCLRRGLATRRGFSGEQFHPKFAEKGI